MRVETFFSFILLYCIFFREKTASWQHGVDSYAAHHALAGHTGGTGGGMGPHTGHTHPHAGHPHTGHPHSTLAAAAPFYAQNVAMMSSWRAYDGAGFQRASPYGKYSRWDLSLFALYRSCGVHVTRHFPLRSLLCIGTDITLIHLFF